MERRLYDLRGFRDAFYFFTLLITNEFLGNYVTVVKNGPK